MINPNNEKELVSKVLSDGIQVVGSTMIKHGPMTVPMLISGLLTVCTEMGLEVPLRESFSAAIETIDTIIAQKESETATKQ
jgi:hypothetical protein